MDFVGRISELNALKLDQIGMQNDWIDPISHLQLIGLDLSSNNLTSGFLRVLHHPKLLRKLRVYNNPMTSDGFEYITQYSGLERLDLTRTQIRSSDCAHIKTLSCLQELDLWHCKGIDDTSVPLLVQMPWLKKVVVASSGLSPSAGRELQRSLPHTKIVTKIGRRSS
ncbi:MAG: hypothetical protein NT069_01225 [Planctomycetota bacterium]|nr:hypothetical protein [Planctomycetota bacterium]